jgi:transcriptional regulator with PAS, ATPase and Fis domain
MQATVVQKDQNVLKLSYMPEVVMIPWTKEFPHAITVCNCEGTILYMNDKAEQTFLKSGGKALVGKNLLDCHPAEARQKLQHLLDTRQGNAYTIEKNGVRKLIQQSPWYEVGEFRGLVELAIELPVELPHFVRQAE